MARRGDAEVVARRLRQERRRRGDAVALLDREARDRQERRVAADERDVGAVQRGDDARRARRRGSAAPGRRWSRAGARSARATDRAARACATSTIFDASASAYGLCSKQRIVARLDLVEDRRSPTRRSRRARRLGADEVHAVAAARQLEADLGGDDAAAAEGRDSR